MLLCSSASFVIGGATPMKHMIATVDGFATIARRPPMTSEAWRLIYFCIWGMVMALVLC